MKKRTIALLVAGGLLLCLLALREIGAVDANLYKLALSSSQVAAMADKVVGGEKHFSYRLTLKCGDKTLDGHQHFDNDLPSIDIEATLDEPVYTGNCALPLIKNFGMKYQCKIATVNSSNHSVDGKIGGTVSARILGLCTRRKAKALAFEEAKKQIWTYLQGQLDH